jgi:hypothetical protein
LEFKRPFETKASHEQGDRVTFFNLAFFPPQKPHGRAGFAHIQYWTKKSLSPKLLGQGAWDSQAEGGRTGTYPRLDWGFKRPIEIKTVV